MLAQTPEPLRITAPAARRFLAERHFLAPPRSLPPESQSVLQVVRRLGSLQFDPLAVAGRNHDLVLHARIAGYRPGWTEALLYDRRVLFEAYNKGLSILPAEELPYYRITWDRAHAEHTNGTLARYPETAAHVLKEIRTRGPLSSLDFERRAVIDWWWGPTSEVRAVLEAFADAGVLGLARRQGNRRLYDLAERLFPAELLAQRQPEEEQLRHKLLSRHRAHGLLGASGSGELWVGLRPTGSTDLRAPGLLRTRLRADLVSRADLVPVQVEGVPGLRYVPGEEVGELLAAQRAIEDGEPESRSVTFLAPLDPFVWDRRFLRALYGFDYVWEVYVPEAKRRWGYYVLPILFGDRLVGRIEPRYDRATRTVRILGLWWEPGIGPRRTPGLGAAMREALDAFRRFHRGSPATVQPG
ncbi:crosslink repair DNA glycosylase YcaQ family protein [soil metagenome]